MYQGISAARVMWLLMRGTIPDGRWVLHTCDNPECVNPEHLFLGTAKDNTQDMLAKNRNVATLGMRNKHAKLTDEQVHLVRRLRLQGFNQPYIAKLVGIHQSQISRITHRVTWRHV